MTANDVLVYSMENRVESPVYPHDVYCLTETGTAQISGGATPLPPEALSVLVMVDGKRTVGDIEQHLPHVPGGLLRDTFRALLCARLLRPVTMEEIGDLGVDFAAFFSAEGNLPDPTTGTAASAAKEASQGGPKLEKNGYYVSIARHALKALKPEGATLNALVVEDDPDMRALVARLLDPKKFSVTTAGGRDEVLARLRQKPSPDVVILDLTLPDLNGFDLLKRLKLHPQFKLIPVVLLTADARRESIVHGLAVGADGYITKPFDHKAFLRGVNAVLGIAD